MIREFRARLRKFYGASPSRPTLLFVALALPSGRPAIEIKGFHLVESQSEKRLLELDAVRARVYKPENLMAMDDLQARVWGQDAEPYRIAGKVGVVQSQTEDFQVHGSSQIISPDGYLFKTENIEFDSTERLLATDDPVEAAPEKIRRGQSLHLVGRGLLINLRKKSYDIRQNVVAEQEISESNTLSIHSQSATILPESRSATFLRNVVVKSPDLELKGGRLVISFGAPPEGAEAGGVGRPDRMVLDYPPGLGNSRRKIRAELKGLKVQSRGMVVQFDAQGGMERSEALGNAEGVTDDGVKLQADTLVSHTLEGQNRIDMRGNVRILTSNRVASCQEAVFFPDSGQIVLNRIASVQNGKEVLEGEVIRFSTKNSEVQVDRARGQIDRRELRSK